MGFNDKVKLKVALLIALAVTLGLIFKTEITDFVKHNYSWERER